MPRPRVLDARVPHPSTVALSLPNRADSALGFRLVLSHALLFLLLLLLPAPIPCQESSPGGVMTLDAETAVIMALERNLDVRSERIDLATRRRTRDTAWNRLLPSLSTGAALSHSKTYGSGQASSSAGGVSPWSLSLSVTTRLSLDGSVVFSIRKTILEYEAERISLEDAERMLTRDVKKAFYSLLLQEAEIGLIEQNIETARTSYDLARKKYDGGLVSEVEVLSAQVNLASLGPELEEAQIAYRTGLMEFRNVLGMEPDVELRLDGELDGFAAGVPVVPEGHFSSRPDVRLLIKETEILETEKRIVTTEEFTPALSLSYSYSGTLADPFGQPWLDVESWSRNGRLSIAIDVPLDPLFPASSSRVRRAEVEDALRKKELALTAKLRDARVQVESIVLTLNKSIRTLDALRKNVELARRIYAMREAEYGAGLSELLEVQKAFDDLREAELDVLTERYNYRAALLDLEYALNTRL